MTKSLKKIFAAAALFSAVTLSGAALADATNDSAELQDNVTYTELESVTLAQDVPPEIIAPGVRPDSVQPMPTNIEPVEVLPSQDPAGIIAQNTAGEPSAQSQKSLPQQLAELAQIMGFIDSNAIVDIGDNELFMTALETIQNRVNEIEARGETVTDEMFVTIMGEAVAEMLQTLDPHSAYFPPVDREEMEQRVNGGFGGLGVGVEYDEDENAVRISAPMADSPAAGVGLQEDDLIIEIDGQSTENMTLEDAVGLMRGEVGTEVNIKIRRAGEAAPLEFTIERAIIKQSAVTSRQIGDDLGYIRLTEFNADASEDVISAIESLKTAMGDDVEGYILDLRFNPGGLLTEAAEIVDAFIDDGIIVTSRERNGMTIYTATNGDVTEGKPLVILVNAASASASEVVSEALQDHDRATIIGTRSFGKGSVQIVLPLSQIFPGRADGMKVTTALYYSPSGDTVQGRGVIPDITVELNDGLQQMESQIEREGDRENAIPNPGGTDFDPSPRTATLSEDFDAASVGDELKWNNGEVDRALLTAIEFLRGESEHIDVADTPEDQSVDVEDQEPQAKTLHYPVPHPFRGGAR